MMVSVLLILAVVGSEARPVYNYVSEQATAILGGHRDSTSDMRDLVIGFGLAGALCVGSTLLPIRIAMRRLAAIERS
jgi:hypothetical protein